MIIEDIRDNFVWHDLNHLISISLVSIHKCRIESIHGRTTQVGSNDSLSFRLQDLHLLYCIEFKLHQIVHLRGDRIICWNKILPEWPNYNEITYTRIQ